MHTNWIDEPAKRGLSEENIAYVYVSQYGDAYTTWADVVHREARIMTSTRTAPTHPDDMEHSQSLPCDCIEYCIAMLLYEMRLDLYAHSQSP